ncbi:MerR family transcriptional regulator [Actinoalloteichus caeruleus]|uniref:MerR HTH family regulatory protein n=1 Tax=Actinoalloteichus caeruleus DSM 43889 TaxID=1120930 RepID=A0ABT1JN48_ACTCY|nr:MerR family transcriptional regulator [Actinoalloteichus caeruleus]MCP2333936.1 MerR HTH family regulatory protein [Actinoalloteichus caeruleus DSM 43889]
MRIGDLARLSGVSPRLLRYYEERGLLTSHRVGHGHRWYADDAPIVVHDIRALLGAGLTTSAIREVLPCAGAGPGTGALCGADVARTAPGHRRPAHHPATRADRTRRPARRHGGRQREPGEDTTEDASEDASDERPVAPPRGIGPG